MSLREKIYAAILSTYKAGEEINPYVIADKCKSVNAVLHSIRSFAEEGVIVSKLSIRCPCCNNVNFVEENCTDKWNCQYCGKVISMNQVSDSKTFAYFMPDEIKL